MVSPKSTIQISGMTKAKLATLREQAKAFGMSAEQYARKLVEDGLSLELEARTKTFDELFAPAQNRFDRSRMRESELDALVDTARTRHQARYTRKKR